MVGQGIQLFRRPLTHLQFVRQRKDEYGCFGGLVESVRDCNLALRNAPTLDGVCNNALY